MSESESVFNYIYRFNIWGQSSCSKYFSGTGSTFEFAKPYIEYINKYIKKNPIKSVVDLGCGDYNVSRMTDFGVAEYLGIDVVGDLIKYNNKIFGSNKTKFLHSDIVADDLPGSDLCIIRQVMQHLSDSDIQTILPKLQIYKHVVIFDEWSRRLVIENKDIRTGGYRNCGIFLELPPFNCLIETLLVYESRELENIFRLIKLISAPERFE